MSRKRSVCVNSNEKRCLLMCEATCCDCQHFREEDHLIYKVIYDASYDRMKILFDFMYYGERKATTWINNIKDYTSGRVLNYIFWDGSSVELTLKDIYNIKWELNSIKRMLEY